MVHRFAGSAVACVSRVHRGEAAETGRRKLKQATAGNTDGDRQLERLTATERAFDDSGDVAAYRWTAGVLRHRLSQRTRLALTSAQSGAHVEGV